MKKSLLAVCALVSAACERQPEESAAAPLAVPQNVIATPGGVSKPEPLVPIPEDKAQLDRMILAGWTPHSGHLHAPGVNECPMSKGSDVVM
ncbi:MAG: hypothetical protein H0V46_02440 [Sphingomonas sp.]|nr:hypothetical protein [Sphingomonas sp.]